MCQKMVRFLLAHSEKCGAPSGTSGGLIEINALTVRLDENPDKCNPTCADQDGNAVAVFDPHEPRWRKS